MSERLNADVIEAAGGIVVRDTPEGPLIAVIYRKRYGPEWALPKGKRQADESWQQTALREVREEIGLRPTIVGVAGATAYLADGVPKLVFYWRMQADGKPPPFTANEETKKLAWLPPAKAIERLTHAEEANLVRVLFRHKGATMQHRGGWLDKYLVPIFQRRRWKRLASDIAAYENGLPGLAKSGAATLPMIHDALDGARAALESGDIDRGWKCLQAAQRLELLAFGEGPDLNAVGTAIRNEADKLSGWRRKAVFRLLTVKEGENQQSANVYRAAHLRDEHYNNEAYKDGLRRGNALRLAFVLLSVVLALLWMDHKAYLLTAGNAETAKPLLSVAVFGLLGAAVSAITNAPSLQGSSRIPEMVSTIRVMALRLLMGPASAMIIYFVMKSNLYGTIFSLPAPDSYMTLAIAFVAGFTERLVLRVVEAIAKSP